MKKLTENDLKEGLKETRLKRFDGVLKIYDFIFNLQEPYGLEKFDFSSKIVQIKDIDKAVDKILYDFYTLNKNTTLKRDSIITHIKHILSHLSSKEEDVIDIEKILLFNNKSGELREKKKEINNKYDNRLEELKKEKEKVLQSIEKELNEITEKAKENEY